MNPSSVAREKEAAMLKRCLLVARAIDPAVEAEDSDEANVFRIAAMVIQSGFPSESKALMECANRYFAIHPAELRAAAEVVRKGHVISLPRLRDSLTLILKSTTYVGE